MKTRKRLKWTSITESEFEHYVERCNFTPAELQILQLRRKGASPVAVALKMNYSDKNIYRISAEIIKKMNKESKWE
jgi:DNA-binding NarL/FixJ family response regulator